MPCYSILRYRQIFANLPCRLNSQRSSKGGSAQTTANGLPELVEQTVWQKHLFFTNILHTHYVNSIDIYLIM